MPSKRLEELIGLYVNQQITPEQRDELDFLISSSSDAELQFALSEVWSGFTGNKKLSDEKSEALLQSILKKSTVEIKPAKEIISVFRIRKWIAAASVTVLLGAGGYFVFHHVNKEVPIQIASHDVAPPKLSHATILLANGKKIFLDSVSTGTLAVQGTVEIKKNAEGKIVYNGDAQPKTETEYNTLVNPRGSKIIALTLADGTRIWLNSESSLKYPVAFNGNNRTVEITGEAYFDVHHDAKMPFFVKTKTATIEDIGTEFDVKAYDEETVNKTTVIKGSVKVNGINSEVLTAGQQSFIDANGKITTSKDVDIEKEIAWKNNTFIFEGDDIHSIMKELSRWYDIDPIYSGETGEHHYTGQISMDVPLSEVLKIFENLGYLKFEINNKNIRVVPTGK